MRLGRPYFARFIASSTGRHGNCWRRLSLSMMQAIEVIVFFFSLSTHYSDIGVCLILLCRWPRTLVACARWRIANFAASPESDAQLLSIRSHFNIILQRALFVRKASRSLLFLGLTLNAMAVERSHAPVPPCGMRCL